MDNNFLKSIQRRIIDFLTENNKKPLYILSRDNCSELSRLAGCWIIKEFPSATAIILKGKSVFNVQNKNHDVLAIKYKEVIYLIDPTIWQFLKRKRSIFIAKEASLEAAIDRAKNFYKGEWSVSEDLIPKKCISSSEWEKIIKENIRTA